MFNLLPNMSASSLAGALAVKSNDMMGLVYLASITRSVLALHKLIDNKEGRVWREKAKADKAAAEAENKDKAAKGEAGEEGKGGSGDAAAAAADGGSGKDQGGGGGAAGGK